VFPAAGRPGGRADVYSTPGIQYAMNLYWCIWCTVRAQCKCALLAAVCIAVEEYVLCTIKELRFA